MARSKKYTILGGGEASSKQLSEWGSMGGRPAKYASNAERQRAYKLRKKQAQLGMKSTAKKVQLRAYRSYGEVKIKRYIICPNCGKTDWNLSKYFNEKGEYIPETYWFDTARWEKFNLQENFYSCLRCSHGFSFLRGEITPQEVRTEVKRAGSSAERSRRRRAKKS